MFCSFSKFLAPSEHLALSSEPLETVYLKCIVDRWKHFWTSALFLTASSSYLLYTVLKSYCVRLYRFLLFGHSNHCSESLDITESSMFYILSDAFFGVDSIFESLVWLFSVLLLIVTQAFSFRSFLNTDLFTNLFGYIVLVFFIFNIVLTPCLATCSGHKCAANDFCHGHSSIFSFAAISESISLLLHLKSFALPTLGVVRQRYEIVSISQIIKVWTDWFMD